LHNICETFEDTLDEELLLELDRGAPEAGRAQAREVVSGDAYVMY